MEIQKTDGIILRNIAIQEADIAAIVFTQNYGKRTFVFKGVKKTKRRSLAAIEPGSIVHLVYYYHEQKAMLNVKEHSLLFDTLSIRDNYKAMIVLFLLLEVLEKTTGYNDPNSILFKLLKGAIGTLAHTNEYTFLALSFILHYLKISGFLPDLFRCCVCQNEITHDIYFKEYQLNPYCQKCAPRDAFIFKEIAPVLHEMLTKKFKEIKYNNYTIADTSRMLFHALLFIDNYFHIHIKSKELLFNTI